ncbi:MAG: hypothetical protein JKX72_05585 [Robiginitomaculum sp.]|nr:hypothetical protein [Robiginitomaculum sp.]
MQILSNTSISQTLIEDQLSGYSLSSPVVESLKNGDIIVKITKANDLEHGKSVDITAKMFIDATDEKIWPILTDCGRASSITPGLIKCEVLEIADDGSWDIRRHTSKIGFGLPHVISEFRSEFSPPHRQIFERSGGDLKALKGRWDILPWPNTNMTLVAYKARISSKSLLPDYLLRQSLKKRIPIVMAALRQEIMDEINSVQ